MSTTPYYRSIKELLQTRSFGIDEYQREYKWDSSNMEVSVNDVLGKFESCHRTGDEPRKAEEYRNDAMDLDLANKICSPPLRRNAFR
jgi:hypothetical protein